MLVIVKVSHFVYSQGLELVVYISVFYIVRINIDEST